MSNNTNCKPQYVREIEEKLANRVFVDVDNETIYVPETDRFDTPILQYESYLKQMGQITSVKNTDLSTITEMQRRYSGKGQDQETATLQDAMGLFSIAVRKKASDIHIRKHEEYADVLFRIDGKLTHYNQWTNEYAGQLCAAIYGAMADVAETHFAPTNPQSARIAKPEMLPMSLYGIRISSVPKVGGFFMALRLLYDDTGVEQGDTSERLQRLGYTQIQSHMIEHMRYKPSGINILAGPTGSGKSTTEKHILESLAMERPDLNIMTIEDPPEYPMSGVVQVPAEVSGKRSRFKREEGFNDAIKAALRSDPDVIMIGEIRDPESAHLALQAAMTGHQVWTTLHANSAFAIITRMCDLLGDKINHPLNTLADNSCLTGMIFQQLVVTLCDDCKLNFSSVDRDTFQHGEYARVMERLAQVMDFYSQDTQICFKNPEGCKKCGYKGETGRTVLSETVAPDPEMLKLVREEPTLSSAQQYWKDEQHGKPIVEHGLEKIQRGEVDPITVEKKLGPLTSDRLFQDGVTRQQEINDSFQDESKRSNRVLGITEAT